MSTFPVAVTFLASVRAPVLLSATLPKAETPPMAAPRFKAPVPTATLRSLVPSMADVNVASPPLVVTPKLPFTVIGVAKSTLSAVVVSVAPLVPIVTPPAPFCKKAPSRLIIDALEAPPPKIRVPALVTDKPPPAVSVMLPLTVKLLPVKAIPAAVLVLTFPAKVVVPLPAF